MFWKSLKIETLRCWHFDAIILIKQLFWKTLKNWKLLWNFLQVLELKGYFFYPGGKKEKTRGQTCSRFVSIDWIKFHDIKLYYICAQKKLKSRDCRKLMKTAMEQFPLMSGWRLWSTNIKVKTRITMLIWAFLWL